MSYILIYCPYSDACKSNDSSGGCFWTELIKKLSIDRARANETCISSGSVLAVIPNNLEIYIEIVDDARKKLNQGWSAVALWLGMIYSPDVSYVITMQSCHSNNCTLMRVLILNVTT